MEHFNHEWGDQNPALPVAVGDRYYAQDLNDDFNYLKHIPFSALLNGRSKGVIVTPQYSYDESTHVLSLTGGEGVILQPTIVTDADESFVIPPATKTVNRYQQFEFEDKAFELTVDDTLRYIVANVKKTTSLERNKTLVTVSYDSRVSYTGELSLKTSLSDNDILVGFIYDYQFVLINDLHINRKQRVFTLDCLCLYDYDIRMSNIATALRNYYNNNTTVFSVLQDVIIKNGTLWNAGNFKDCRFSISTNGNCLQGGTYTDCEFSITQSGINYGISAGTFVRCKFAQNTIYLVNANNVHFEDCDFEFDAITGTPFYFNSYANTFKRCNFTIGNLSGSARVFQSTSTAATEFENCKIIVGNLTSSGSKVIRAEGSSKMSFNNCQIAVGTLHNSATGIEASSSSAKVYLKYCDIEFNNSAGTPIQDSDRIHMSFDEVSDRHSGDYTSVDMVLCIINRIVRSNNQS